MMRLSLICALVMLVVSGCGVKGDLRLPAPETTATQ